MNYVCARSVPDWHASSGMDISHSRVCKEMRALGLVRQTPAEGLPPAPVRAAAALFLGMHERLGAYSPVFLLDVPLIAYILDLYATIYAQLPGVDEFGDLAPWSKALLPANPHAHFATGFTVAQSVSALTEIIEPRLQVRGVPVPSARRSSRVLHLPSRVSARIESESGTWRPSQLGGLAEGAGLRLPTFCLPSASGIEREGGGGRLKGHPSRGDSDGGGEHEHQVRGSADDGALAEDCLEIVLSNREARTRATAPGHWQNIPVDGVQQGPGQMPLSITAVPNTKLCAGAGGG